MRFPLAVVLALVSLTTFLSGCSEQGSANQTDSALKVQISQMFITVKNEAGIPLSDVTVSIVPQTRTTVYTKYVGRFENAESRDLMLGDFGSRDGTPFSLRVVKPKSVEVKGTGVDGKAYTVTVPWK
jgi:hypothetical protein